MRKFNKPTEADYDRIHGYDPSQCPKCGGIGVVMGGSGFVTCPNPECAAGKQRYSEQYARLCKIAAIPKRYQHARLSDFDVLAPQHQKGKRTAQQAASVFARSENGMITPADIKPDTPGQPRNWLIFTGAVGTGKTYMAVAVINALIERGKPCRYIRLDDILSEARDAVTSDTPLNSVLERYKLTPVLLIDEFTVRRVSDYTFEVVESLLRYRHSREMPTLFTTTISQDDVSDVWGKDHNMNIATILSEALWVRLGGPPIRNYVAEFSDDD